MAFGEPRDDQAAWLPGDCCSFSVLGRGLTKGRYRCFPNPKGLEKRSRSGDLGRRSVLHNYGAGGAAPITVQEIRFPADNDGTTINLAGGVNY
jgi:hypothetical protein